MESGPDVLVRSDFEGGPERLASKTRGFRNWHDARLLPIATAVSWRGPGFERQGFERHSGVSLNRAMILMDFAPASVACPA